jgi:hypothetical protein
MTTGLSHWEKKRTAKRSPAIDSPLLSMIEAAAYTRQSVSSLYSKRFEFDLVRIGRRCFITRESCDRFIAARLQKASS